MTSGWQWRHYSTTMVQGESNCAPPKTHHKFSGWWISLGCQASWRAASKCDDATGFAGHTINTYGSANVKGGPLEGEGWHWHPSCFFNQELQADVFFFPEKSYRFEEAWQTYFCWEVLEIIFLESYYANMAKESQEYAHGKSNKCKMLWCGSANKTDWAHCNDIHCSVQMGQGRLYFFAKVRTGLTNTKFHKSGAIIYHLTIWENESPFTFLVPGPRGPDTA